MSTLIKLKKGEHYKDFTAARMSIYKLAAKLGITVSTVGWNGNKILYVKFQERNENI